MRTAIALITVLSVLSACGGEEQAITVPAGSAVRSTTTSPTATTTTGVAPSETTTSVDDQRPASERYAEILPTIQDMPAGWSQEPASTDDEVDPNDCMDAAFASTGTDSAEVGFSQSQTGPFLVFGVDQKDAVGDLQELSTKIAACDGYTDSDGNTWSIRPLSFPKIGDETLAFRADGSGASFPVTASVVFVQANDLVFMAAAAAIMGPPPDAELIVDILRAMELRSR